MSKQILCVSWDRNLARTREMLLASAGFEVVSALGAAEAMAACSKMTPDLLVLGYSVPQPEKRQYIQVFRKNSKSPVLSMITPPQRPLPEADFAIDTRHDPQELIRVVSNILESGGATAPEHP